MAFLYKYLSVLAILLTISNPVLANTQAIASVSSNSILLGDIFILNVEVNDTGSEYQLDSSVLANDFSVSRPSRNQQSSYINGKSSKKTQWTVRLQAKKIGTFTIPALKLGDLFTAAIEIEVKQPGDQPNSAENAPIFIENSINKSRVYINQSFVLTSKIYISENINNGDIQPPVLSGASIELSGDKQQNKSVRNGILYQVLSYQYLITPSQSGEVKITSPLLVGSVRKTIAVSEWQNKIIASPINIRGNNLNLTVKSIPTDFQGDWLISEDVRLLENNNLQQEEFHVGDPITRSISLQIASVPLDKMPNIPLNYDNSLRYYPDKDELKQGQIDNLLYSERTITHAIIAKKSGELILPEIKIAWWNSVTEKQQFTTLPAQTLNIKAALKEETAQSFPIPSQPAISQTENFGHDLSGQLLAWKISTFSLLLALLLLLFYHFRSKPKTLRNEIQNTDINNHTYLLLLSALQKAQPATVYACLLRYLQSQQAHITQLQQFLTLTDLSQDNKQQLAANLQQLELACAGQPHHWEAKKLIELVKQHQQLKNLNASESLLTLNP